MWFVFAGRAVAGGLRVFGGGGGGWRFTAAGCLLAARFRGFALVFSALFAVVTLPGAEFAVAVTLASGVSAVLVPAAVVLAPLVAVTLQMFLISLPRSPCPGCR